jgi:signal transduction histidine kinase
MDVGAAVAGRPVRLGAGAGWAAAVLALALVGTGAGLTVTDHRWLWNDDLALGCVVAIGTALLSAFILTREPTSRIGWLFAVAGLTRSVTVAAQAWAVHALQSRPGSLPGGAFASWLQAWAVLPGIAVVPLLIALFPAGEAPPGRWRVIPIVSGVAFVLLITVVPIGMWSYRGPRLLPDAPMPSGTRATVVVAAMVAGLGLAVLGIVLALAALIGRARQREGRERQQIKWFGYGAVCALVLNLIGDIGALHIAWIRLLGAVAVLVGIGFGIFRYRLYDIDRLINRTLVYGLVTLVVAAVFAALDVTLAAIVGDRSAVIVALSAFAGALALRPARDHIQDAVDRVFDRRRHDSVRNLRELAQRVGHEHVGPDEVQAALRESLRDPGLRLLFRRRDASGLMDGSGTLISEVGPATGQVVDPVTRHGEQIALLIHAPASPLLLDAVVRAASPVLEHARLQAELRVQLAEVRASRSRLVAASDLERRRIERDLHDGAQQRLVGLALHLQTARRRSSALPDDVLGFSVDQLNLALSEIRGLVHGLLPPALVSGGLPAALAELRRPGTVTVRCTLTDRLDPGVEATGWFVACEGVANAAKHAAGSHVQVVASMLGAALVIEVCDDGPGGANPHGEGLRHLADRVEAHGGTLHVDSPTGAGTRLRAELPCGS